MWEELENALAWYQSAPSRWIQSAKQDLAAAAEWIWGVLQGDFNEEATTAQTVTGTVISMIPLVDQLCDVRDVVANCKKINAEPDNNWHWVALGLTLIGLFPTLGSLVKGCGKILFAYARKGALDVTAKGMSSTGGKLGKEFVEAGIAKLNAFLDRPEVRRTLKALKIDNPYKWLAAQLREVKAQVNIGALRKAFDQAYSTLTQLLDLVQKWASPVLVDRAKALLNIVDGVRRQLDQKMAQAIKPLQDILDQLARRLDVEADNTYRAYLKTTNVHHFNRPAMAAELDVFRTNKPVWVDVRKAGRNRALKDKPEIPEGYPNITATEGALKEKWKTFHTLANKDIPPGETLYRVVDPGSFDNSIAWMRKKEFDTLTSKADWRRRFAVWANWNGNGEFVTYTVPPGKPLKVWEGKTASQELKDDAHGTTYWLEGGATQIVLDPKNLEKSFLGKRQPSGWGYTDFSTPTDKIGVPQLTNNWRE